MSYSLYPEICQKKKNRLAYNKLRASPLQKPQITVKELTAVDLCMVVIKILHQHLLQEILNFLVIQENKSKEENNGNL